MLENNLFHNVNTITGNVLVESFHILSGPTVRFRLTDQDWKSSCLLSVCEQLQAMQSTLSNPALSGPVSSRAPFI